MNCTIIRKLKVEQGDINDYKQLARYHYRENKLGPYSAIFAIKSDGSRRQTVGVIVYALPAMAVEMRNVALGGILSGISKRDKLSFVNINIRNISRVVIEPRFRGLGLAARLVRETLGLINVPIVEALAVMGHVNPFFEKAGMKAYAAKESLRCVQLIEALGAAGITKEILIDPQLAQRKLDALARQENNFVEQQMKIFLQSYGTRRNMPGGIERTKFVLGKLTQRPVYYIWFRSVIASRDVVHHGAAISQLEIASSQGSSQ
jgi:hypothetical protein